ncbi:MAG: phnA protein [Gammaproteobacteria bacterium]
MARGLDSHLHRKDMLERLGKELTRRAHHRCELCDAAHVPLRAYEVPPIPDEPDVDHCAFICDICREQIEQPRRMDPNHWHGALTRSVWSGVPAVQTLAVALLNRLAGAGDAADWALELSEQLFLEPEVSDWVERSGL